MGIPAVILAGGLGTRLKDVILSEPKVMTLVNNVPFITYVIANLKKCGVESLVMCVGHQAKKIEDYLENGKRFGVTIRYSYDVGPTDNRTIGTAAAVRKALVDVEGPFLVVNGDTLLLADIRSFVTAQQTRNAKACLIIYKNNNKIWRSNVSLQEWGILYSKSSLTENYDYIDAGTGYFTRQIFEEHPHINELPKLYFKLCKERMLWGWKTPSRFYEINTRESLKETQCFITGIESEGL